MLFKFQHISIASLLFSLTISTVTAQVTRSPEIGKKDPPPRLDLYGDPLPDGALLRLGNVRFRHDGRLFAVAYASDGKSLVTASSDDTVRRWDPVTGKERKRTSVPGFVALSPDGSVCLSIDIDDPRTKKKRKVRLSNTVTDKEIGEFEWFGRYGEADVPSSLHVAFSRDGTTLAVGSYDAKFILLWDIVRSREIRQINYIGLQTLALSPDGKTLITGTQHTLWDVGTGNKLKTFSPRYEYGDTTAIAFSQDGKVLAFGGSDGSILLFDVASGKQLKQFKKQGKYFGGAGSSVTSLAFSSDGKTLAFGSNDWTVHVWDVVGGKQLHQLVGPTFGNVGNHGSIYSVAFSPDDQMIAAAGNVPMLRIWETVSGREMIPPVSGHRDMILALAYSPDGKQLASASADLTIRIWDTTSGKEILQLQGHEGSINGLAFSQDGRQLVSAGGFKDETLRWWDTTTGKNVRTVNAGYSNAVAFSHDGKMIATAGTDGISLWDSATSKSLRLFKGRAYHVFFSSDGRFISDGTNIWDLAKNELITEFKIAKEVIFSPDWKLLVAVGENDFGSGVYSARLLEMVTDSEIHTFVKDKGWISTAVFSSDGKRVATAASKGIRVWDTSSGKEIQQVTDTTSSWHYLIAFSPDGKTLASINSDMSILIWKVSPAEIPKPDLLQTPAEISDAWEKLSSSDAKQAFTAIECFVRSPEKTLSLMKMRVQPVTAPSPAKLNQLIADLDHNRFSQREKASKELEQLGELGSAPN